MDALKQVCYCRTRNTSRISSNGSSSSCFFCSMKDTNPIRRGAKIAQSFKEIALRDSEQHVLVLSGLWNIAMSQPDDPEFPSLGLFDCMTKLLQKSVTDTDWLLRGQNIYIPYYAAHIIGSYTMNKAHLAEKAAESGAVPALMEIFRGKISWVEMRVAARALGHLASHEKSLKFVALHEKEMVELSMEIACNCLENVYKSFVGVEDGKRVKYHSDLLTRGLGGIERENRKAEEWGSQLQSWCLYILNCFALKEKSLEVICRKDFLRKVSKMWGGLVNRSSPGGTGLIKTLCKSKIGRKKIAECREVIEKLCDLSRSSDDWKFMAVETLLILLRDPDVRFHVLDVSASKLADLAEDVTFGDKISRVLLQDYHKIRYGGLRLKNKKSQRAIESIWELKVERRKKEKLMSKEELKRRAKMAAALKKEGKERFLAGFVDEAIDIYTNAIEFCSLEMVKDRVVLYSNRAQCYLLVKKPESAVSDATRALCLSGAARPHGKSLWRRSQAYDMMGLARESLTDGLMFVHGRLKVSRGGRIPYYAATMIGKQMNATWLFRAVALDGSNGKVGMVGESDGGDEAERRRAEMMLMDVPSS